MRIGFTANSSVVTSNGETTFTIGILSGQLQFGVSVRVMLTAVGPIKGLYIIKSVKKNYMYKGIEINIIYITYYLLPTMMHFPIYLNNKTI